MTKDELNKKRDGLADEWSAKQVREYTVLQDWLCLVPKTESITTNSTLLSDHEDKSICACEFKDAADYAFRNGFNAAVELLWLEREKLEAKLQKAVEGLDEIGYDLQKEWMNIVEGDSLKNIERQISIGIRRGTIARQALKEIGEGEA